jgi:hypothetical protein
VVAVPRQEVAAPADIERQLILSFYQEFKLQ